MSRRHRSDLADALSFQERRAHARRERQRVNARLRELAAVHGDGDEPGTGWRPERRHEARVEPTGRTGRRRVRHWKQAFWKRRSASRRERAVLERAVARQHRTPTATLYTVGHGTRTTEELLDVVRGAGVARIADVRRYPASRRHPHLGRDQLARSLPAGGVAYEWWGETLGGRRRARPIDATRHRAWREESFRAYADHMDEPEFRRAFLALLDGARTTPTAVMCAETVWWRCHRRLIADAAVLRGVDVLHLGIGRSGAHGSASRAADTPKRHVLHEAVRADADGWPVYDAE